MFRLLRVIVLDQLLFFIGSIAGSRSDLSGGIVGDRSCNMC